MSAALTQLGILAADSDRAADALLVEQLRAGDQAAYEALLARFEQPVYNLVYRMLDCPEDVDDVVQEVFVKVFRNLDSFRGDSSLKTWIYRIAFNEASNHRRWVLRHRGHEVGLESGEDGSFSLEDRLPDRGRSAFERMVDIETRQAVEEALQKVSPVFRAAVILRDIEDLSYEEIAEVLQISLGTVKSRILRGREQLRRVLEQRLQPVAAGWRAAAAPAE